MKMGNFIILKVFANKIFASFFPTLFFYILVIDLVQHYVTSR